MANILSKLGNIYKKSTTAFEQASLIFLLVCIGALTINYFNNNRNSNSNSTTATDNIYATFKCPLTPLNEVKTLDTSALKTSKTMSLINYDTEVYETGMTKNQIPAVLAPKYVKLEDLSPCLGSDDELIVVKIADNVRAYSKRILRYHIIINDTLGDIPLIVTYSPLSNHYQVYNRSVKTEQLSFGTSGLLYKNADLLFDSKTETLWSQLTGKALVGNMVGASLTKLSFEVLSYSETIQKYGNISAVSFVTGFTRDYNQDPFISYAQNQTEIVGKITNYTDDLTYKTQVAGFKIGNSAFAVPVTVENFSGEKIAKNETLLAKLKFENGRLITIEVNNTKYSFDQLYWFVWYDLYPQTKLLELV